MITISITTTPKRYLIGVGASYRILEGKRMIDLEVLEPLVPQAIITLPTITYNRSSREDPFLNYFQ